MCQALGELRIQEWESEKHLCPCGPSVLVLSQGQSGLRDPIWGNALDPLDAPSDLSHSAYHSFQPVDTIYLLNPAGMLQNHSFSFLHIKEDRAAISTPLATIR